MAINWTTTESEGAADWVKFLVYGPAGVGKTALCATAPAPLILSAEAGLLSLRPENQVRMFGESKDIPVIVIKTAADLQEAYQFVATSAEARYFETICLDSLSEISEVILAHMLTQAKDPRQAYGEMNQKMAQTIRAFRDLPGKHVYFAAKQERTPDENNRMFYGASMPGKTLLRDVPHFFDEVFALGIGQLPDKTPYRFLRTRPDIQFQAKDRSGTLDEIEQPNLTAIINKIRTK